MVAGRESDIAVANVRLDTLERNVQAMNAVVTNVASTQAVTVYQQSENKTMFETLQRSIADLRTDIADRMDTAKNANSLRIDNVEEKLEALSRWRWILVGGGAVIGFILTVIISNLDKLAILFV